MSIPIEYIGKIKLIIDHHIGDVFFEVLTSERINTIADKARAIKTINMDILQYKPDKFMVLRINDDLNILSTEKLSNLISVDTIVRKLRNKQPFRVFLDEYDTMSSSRAVDLLVLSLLGQYQHVHFSKKELLRNPDLLLLFKVLQLDVIRCLDDVYWLGIKLDTQKYDEYDALLRTALYNRLYVTKLDDWEIRHYWDIENTVVNVNVDTDKLQIMAQDETGNTATGAQAQTERHRIYNVNAVDINKVHTSNIWIDSSEIKDSVINMNISLRDLEQVLNSSLFNIWLSATKLNINVDATDIDSYDTLELKNIINSRLENQVNNLYLRFKTLTITNSEGKSILVKEANQYIKISNHNNKSESNVWRFPEQWGKRCMPDTIRSLKIT